MSELPERWLKTTLGQVVNYADNETADPADMSPEAWLLELEDIERDTGKVLERKTVGERVPKSSKNRFQAGDVLYGKLRPYLNKVVRADQDGFCSSEIIAISPGLLDKNYLFYSMRSPSFIEYVSSVSHGMRMPRLGTQQAKSAPFVLPPQAEQIRIAAKLDELLAQVDTLKARIDAIPALLKRFRQSVLAAAVSGRLTEEWREKNTGDLGFLLNPKAKALGIEELASAEELLTEPLPTFWKKYALEQLVEPDRGIPYGIVQTGSAVEKGIPTVRCGDVKNLFIDTSSLKKVSPEIEHEYKRTRLKGGEVLLAIRGSEGNAGVVPAALRDCNISREVAMIPTLPSVLPFYLACLLQSPLGQRLLVGKVRGVAQKGINLADVKRLPVALPPYAEQTEIVHRVEKLFAFADQLEAKVASAKSRIDHLTQSILAKAFRGELVPQDPNDEPASVLLERIKTQRATAPKARRGRGKSMSAWTAATEGT